MPVFEILSKSVPLSDMYENHYDLPRFRKLCEECGNYNNVYTCPPYDFDDVNYLKDYSHILLIVYKIVFTETEREKYFGEEYIEFSKESILEAVYSLQNTLFEMEKIYPETLSLGMGGCKICDECSKPKGLPCKFPEKLRYAPEALGFNMMSILQSYFDVEMKWAVDRLPEYYTVLSGLCSKGELKISNDKIIEVSKSISR